MLLMMLLMIDDVIHDVIDAVIDVIIDVYSHFHNINIAHIYVIIRYWKQFGMIIIIISNKARQGINYHYIKQGKARH